MLRSRFPTNFFAKILNPQDLHRCKHNLHFPTLAKKNKKYFFGQVTFAQITTHHCTFLFAVINHPSEVRQKHFAAKSIKRSASFYETKNANFVSVFLFTRELLQFDSPRSHYPLSKNWAWPQHSFLISFRAKTRLILLVMRSSQPGPGTGWAPRAVEEQQGAYNGALRTICKTLRP